MIFSDETNVMISHEEIFHIWKKETKGGYLTFSKKTEQNSLRFDMRVHLSGGCEKYGASRRKCKLP